MKEAMDHDLVSELLDRHIRGELTPELAAEVETHLAGCADCSTELKALNALETTGEPAPLTELERAGLRRAVLTQAVPLPDASPAAAATPTEPSRAGGGWYQFLGAAALIAAVLGFAYLGFGGDTGGNDTAATSESADEPSLQMEAQEEGAEGGSSLTQDAAAGSAAAGRDAVGPTFEQEIKRYDSEGLNRFAKRGLSLVVFSKTYVAEDVSTLRDEFVERLANEAGGDLAETIRTCAALVFTQTPGALPAYAAEADFEPARGKESRVLVLGFAFTKEETGPLARAMVWAWPVGDCETVLHYTEDIIRPRK